MPATNSKPSLEQFTVPQDIVAEASAPCSSASKEAVIPQDIVEGTSALFSSVASTSTVCTSASEQELVPQDIVANTPGSSTNIPEENHENATNSLEQNVLGDASGITWHDPEGSKQEFFFHGEFGLNPEVLAQINEPSELDCYKLFVGDDLLDVFVEQTNIYASQKLKANNIPQNSRINMWVPTNREEIMNFLGIIAYMGIIKAPSISDYWTTDPFFKISAIPSTMSRNRFELLLRMWHFSNNELQPENDRLYKLSNVVDYLISKCQKICTPGETVCVDESIVPFKGRLLMKQYCPMKAHKYGVKIFKACFGKGYTWNLKIYSGKHQDAGNSVPTSVVLQLCGPLLNSGRVIVTDNYYTSIDLADKLLDKSTNLLGTLRSNRKNNPKTVVHKKLKKGEMVAQQNEKGITILKWADKREILVLSTCHGDETVPVQRRNGIVNKPKAILDYNKGKAAIDLSDQLSSYSTPLRRSLKWYRKVAIELLLGTAVVNAHIVFCQITGKKQTITNFRKALVKQMITVKALPEPETENQDVSTPIPNKRTKTMTKHTFRKMEGSAREGRKYCRGCYEKKRGEIEKTKVKKVTTYCSDCTGEPRYCLDCFNCAHK